MKTFIIESITYFLICVGLILLCFILVPVGCIGDVYPRITSPLQHSLVLGTSRSAQAINPVVLDSVLDPFYEKGLYNFSFHLDISSYNEDYADAIRKKIKTTADVSKCYFILTVDPWVLDGGVVSPHELRLNRVDLSPNVEYLVRNFDRTWFSPLPKHSYVNESGRTEVDYEPKTETEWKERVKVRLESYYDRARNFKYSKDRERILKNLILYLKKRGDVYLVRIPTSKPMLEIENSISSDFSDRMKRISERTDIPYLDFSNQDYATTDGNHLTMTAGNKFSKVLADSILLIKRNIRQVRSESLLKS